MRRLFELWEVNIAVTRRHKSHFCARRLIAALSGPVVLFGSLIFSAGPSWATPPIPRLKPLPPMLESSSQPSSQPSFQSATSPVLRINASQAPQASFRVTQSGTPIPRLKPAPPALSVSLSDPDAKAFRGGLSAISKQHWTKASAAIRTVQDPVSKDVLRWARATKDKNTPTSELKYIQDNLTNWPRLTTIRAKAEHRMFDDNWPTNAVLDWFLLSDPVSGEGRAAFARAHYARGNKGLGDHWLRLAWRDSKLTRDRQKKIFKTYSKRLSKDDHAARADHLIWQGRSHFDKANALLPHMSKSNRAVINARMKIARNSSGMNSAINAVPQSKQNDPAFLYARAHWRRLKKTKRYALPLYLAIDASSVTETGQTAIWKDKRLMAYWAISEKDYANAYRLTQKHGMSSGTGFAEAEFLAGWIALTQLHDPNLALPHFERLRDGVKSPISLARAHYWVGRSHAKLRNEQDRDAYRQAAQYPNTYYGMLASQELSGRLSQIILPPELVSDLSKMQFEADERTRALHLLGEAGEERLFSQMVFHMDDEAPNLETLSLLSKISADYGYMRPSLRAAKQAGRFQSMLTESGYPIIGSIAALPSHKFEQPFVYAIARQESEFAPNAVSSAKAYGLMQMINSTAKITARKHRIPYSRTRLASDADYAANMGALHLNDLLEMWDGSYILAAASYNAGPSRAKQWITAYGDPRDPHIDPIDWVEKVPFSETRNYIQRVLENMQVYRARLNQNIAPNQLYRDLHHGQVRP